MVSYNYYHSNMFYELSQVLINQSFDYKGMNLYSAGFERVIVDVAVYLHDLNKSIN